MRSQSRETHRSLAMGNGRDRAMENYEPILSFGEEVAERYDDAPRGDEPEGVAFLRQLAADCRRWSSRSVPGGLRCRWRHGGVRVDGIDMSPAMVARLRAKPGGDGISVTIGNFADVPVPDSYRLIFVVFNTLFNLLTQDDQLRCFENVAAHLTEDGRFVVEAQVPIFLTRLRDDQYVDAEAVGVDEVRLDVGRYDPVKQHLVESRLHVSVFGR